MKKRIGVILAILLMLLSGCGATSKDDMTVFYINKKGNTLSKKQYAQMDVTAMLAEIDALSILPKDVELERYQIVDSQIELCYNEAYLSMSKTREVLARAAIVQNLVQCESVEYVSFYIEDEPLKDSHGNVIGMMRAEDFVQSTASSGVTYLFADLTLYVPDSDGKKLKKVEKNNLKYSANKSIEKLVVEQLVEGSTIPKSVVILGVSVKEGICYVNFDSKFLQESYDFDPEITIYSIVNSIIANGNVNKVQILIDGQSDVVYKNKVDLSKTLEWKEIYIKETSKE